jgi:HAD superfamily hydrolase (TIGR01509 family)
MSSEPSGPPGAPPGSAAATRAGTLLLDADDTLFPSEGPAAVVSAAVLADLADRLGLPADDADAPDRLRRERSGRNFRSTAQELLARHGTGVESAELDAWVRREQAEVAERLGRTLRPRPDVLAALTALSGRYRLAVVSSSGSARIATCLRAAGLAGLIPAHRRFSAEDSLPVPAAKPDPAVYRFALRRLGVRAPDALAVEDSVAGARAALDAGITTLGIVQFVPGPERADRAAALLAEGVSAVAGSWDELTGLFTRVAPGDIRHG